jgi:hypothetical protein
LHFPFFLHDSKIRWVSSRLWWTRFKEEEKVFWFSRVGISLFTCLWIQLVVEPEVGCLLTSRLEENLKIHLKMLWRWQSEDEAFRASKRLISQIQCSTLLCSDSFLSPPSSLRVRPLLLYQKLNDRNLQALIL